MAKARKFGTADRVSVRSRYEKFLRSATSLIGSHGATFKAQNLSEILLVELSANEQITVRTKKECGLWLSGLPLHKGDKSKVIEVCLNLVQNIGPGEKTELQLLASNVHVSYFEQKRSGMYKILESWHFDFAPNQAGHPVFHAQLTKDHLPEVSEKYNYKPQHRDPAPKDLPRIPTPPIDLAAVMEIIITDHLVDYHSIVDSDNWRKTADSLPQLPMEQLSSRESRVEKLKARHWYPVV